MILSRSIHVAASSIFHSLYGHIVFHGVYIYLYGWIKKNVIYINAIYIYPLFDGHLGCFLAMNIGVCVSF